MKKRSLADWLGICEDTVTGLALLVMVSAVLWGVLTRYITAQPAVWTSELSGIVFTWVVFIGAMAAFRKRAHINVPLLVDSLPAKAQRVVTLLADVLVLVFVAYTAFLSFGMMIKGATRLSPVMNIPFSLVYLAPFIAFSMMTLQAALRLWLWTSVPAPRRPGPERLEGGDL